jgi:Chalcone isomerase-like
VRIPLRRALILFAIMVPVWFSAQAAEFDGIQLPDTIEAGGKTLKLNGFGRRTYSFLGIHIYVASLYLEQLSSNPEQILRSPETKLLNVRFERNVSAEDARKAWREGLANNCQLPCQLDPQDVETFLAEVSAMQEGEVFSLLFTQRGATVTVNGKQIGIVSKPQFAEAMLATFLGPRPASPRLKQELLRGRT